MGENKSKDSKIMNLIAPKSGRSGAAKQAKGSRGGGRHESKARKMDKRK
jgi:hypothetical protein